MSTTSTGEEVIFSARTHAKILIGPIIIQAVLITIHVLIHNELPTFGHEMIDQWLPVVLHGILAVFQLIYVLVPVLRWIMTKFTLTDQTVRMSHGILSRRTREIQVSRITQVEMERSLFDYIFGCGTILLHEASGTGYVKLDDVPQVVRAKRELDSMIGPVGDIR